MNLSEQLSQELNISLSQVEAAVKLLDEGNTVPFIARYRKEVTGSLDDTQLRDLAERLQSLRNLEKRREEIRASIEEQGAMTEELTAAIARATTQSALEDLYQPFKKKRRTRASVAREKGLEPLAQEIFEQTGMETALSRARRFVDAEKGVETPEDALAGARDIIAEWISDNAAVRGALRSHLERNAVLRACAAVEDTGVYAQYADFSTPLSKAAGYQILAINRGEREEILKAGIEADQDACLAVIERLTVKRSSSPSVDVVKEAAADALKRLLYPSMENELRNALTDTACEQAIRVFGLNLRPLLMQPPLKGRVVLGFDPAYRTGCKLAVVDATGKVLDTTVIYPTPPQNKTEQAAATLRTLIRKYGITAIAIGNGTASKESEIFVSGLLKEFGGKVAYMVVSEAGASVYSASKLGAEEFPQFDVSLRSAVSIARRLQDPLAELVKIDPKAIGVGQYQHDMPAKKLDETLSAVVEDCVNAVGVDANTASVSLLSYIAGIGPALARNIVAYREENGHFSSRKELMKVPKLGKKAFEQAAGFLRVSESDEPLDTTGVHPESYKAARALLKACGGLENLTAYITSQGEEAVAAAIDVGVPTLQDMVKELLKPGRDPRDELPPPMLRSDLMDLSDLKPEMVMEGTVRNVVDFGAFVDIGVHEDGLVHISRICDRFIRHPSEVLHVGDVVKVKVLEVDVKRKRISLTMKGI